MNVSSDSTHGLYDVNKLSRKCRYDLCKGEF